MGGPSPTDKPKRIFYLPVWMLDEIQEEATRLDRSMSWVVQRTWKLARAKIQRLLGVNDDEGGVP